MNSRSRVKVLAGVGSIIAISAAVLAAVALTNDVRPIRPGSRAPGFRAVNVATGDTVVLENYAGDVVLLNIWATICAPCEIEMPSMQRLYEQLGPSGLKIVAVSVDDDDSELVRRWVDERGLTFDVLHDRSGSIMTDYQATGWPESFIIGKDGLIVRKVWGAAEWDDPAEVAVFERLLQTTTPDGED